MAEPQVVSALTAKRSEIAGIIADLDEQIAQHHANLGHADAVLRLYGQGATEATGVHENHERRHVVSD
jgi:hypothetical protein